MSQGSVSSADLGEKGDKPDIVVVEKADSQNSSTPSPTLTQPREKAEEELLGLRERHESMLSKMELLKRTVETLQYEKELFRESGERERDVAALQSDGVF